MSVRSRAFGKILTLAWRNLLRNRRRTLINLSFIMIGVVAMGVARGYFVQTMYGLQEIAIRSGLAGSLGSGHLIIRDARYASEEERYALEFGMEQPDEIVAAASTLEGFDYALVRSQLGGLASNGEKSLPFKGWAVEPEAEARLRDGLRDMAERTQNLSLGEELRRLGRTPHGVLIGQGLARALHLKEGDPLLLLGTTVDGGVNAVDVVIVGLLYTGSDEVDRLFVIVSHDTAADLINSTRVGEVSVMLRDRDAIEPAAASLVQTLGAAEDEHEYTVTRWEESGVYYRAVRDLFSFMFAFLEVIIVVIVLISSWSIVNMTTMERVQEIGTLRAIGLKLRTITGIFLMEGAILGLLAVGLGLALQLLVVYLINSAAIQMPPVPGGNQGFILKVQYFTEYHLIMTAAVVAAIVAANFASFFTIRRLTIVEALEHV
jgi:putative ABC transport system permease protein